MFQLPDFNSILSYITGLVPEIVNFFSGELFFLCIAGLICWCINKRAACKILFSLVIGGSICSIVQAATGFALPSYNVFLIFCLGTGIFVNFHSVFLKIVCIILCFALAFAHFYFRLSAPVSIYAGAVIGVITVLGISFYIDGTIFDKRQNLLYAGILLIPVFILVCVTMPLYFNDTIGYSFMSALINRTGLFAGVVISWFIESSYINFSTRESNGWRQFVKFLLGIFTLVLFHYGCRFLFSLIPSFILGKFCSYMLTAGAGLAAYPCFIKRILFKTINRD